MAPHRNWDPACKVYIGNLRDNANESEIENIFSKYGPLKNVWIARNPPGFAFVEYEDARDAEDAVKELHGTRCCGARIVVEMATGKPRNRDRGYRRSSPYKRRFSPPQRFRSRSPVYKR